MQYRVSAGDWSSGSETRRSWRCGAVGWIMSVLLLFPASNAYAQTGPDYWQVTGVAANDHLNVRNGPSAQHPIVTTAPNGFRFRNLGCRGSGNSRWCHVETPNGQISGWVAGRYLREPGAPVAAQEQRQDVPELHMRNSGEIEVRFRSGCTTLYNPAGRRVAAGSSCSRQQLGHAHDAVESYMRENSPSLTHGADRISANVNLSGQGTFYGGDTVKGSIVGHREGAYALIVQAGGGSPLCTGLIKHVPGSVASEAVSVHCTDGAHGTAVLARNRSGHGLTMAFTLSDRSGGYVLFQ